MSRGPHLTPERICMLLTAYQQLGTIRAAAEEVQVSYPAARRHLILHDAFTPRPRTQQYRYITTREPRIITELYAAAFPCRLIAQVLRISEKTVRNHLRDSGSYHPRPITKTVSTE